MVGSPRSRHDRPILLLWLDLQSGTGCFMLFAGPATTRDLVSRAELVVGAVLVPGTKAPKLVTGEMVKTMKKGPVLEERNHDSRSSERRAGEARVATTPAGV